MVISVIQVSHVSAMRVGARTCSKLRDRSLDAEELITLGIECIAKVLRACTRIVVSKALRIRLRLGGHRDVSECGQQALLYDHKD